MSIQSLIFLFRRILNQLLVDNLVWRNTKVRFAANFLSFRILPIEIASLIVF